MNINLENISKNFGNISILKDINLTFPSKKFITLLGPSGCGKTTLLRMIAGLEEITVGNILFGEQKINNVPPGERNIAMVFQSYALYPQMTVRKNIGYGLRVRKTPSRDIDTAVEKVAHLLEIEHLLDRKPGQLSGGQRQRVALGRAMVRKPDVFLMDEPLSNLDAKLRVTMRGELRRFHLNLEATTIYVTHDQLEAMTMSDLVVVMHKGVVQQFGTPEEIYKKPVNLYVAGFIGNPPMNFLDGKIEYGKFIVENISLVLPPLKKEIASDPKAILGVRPQELTFVPADTANTLQGCVTLIELHGSEKLIEVEIVEKKRINILVRADMSIAMGEIVNIGFNMNHIHVFDEKSGEALLE